MFSLSGSEKPVVLKKASNGKTSCEIVFDCPELVTMRFKIEYRSCLPIDILLEGLSNFRQNEIDYLEIIGTCYNKCDFTNNWDKFIKLISYFKRVDITSNFIMYGQGFYNSMKRLSSIDNNSKFGFNLKVNIDSSFWNEIDQPICLKIKFLCILDIVDERTGGYVDEDMTNTICKKISMMHELETLIFRFRKTYLGVNFANFIQSASRNLKNIQIQIVER
uniref:BTB domain-containing protein n=1 Tax=Strongyloides papillosus TaxID=174720 RepID=A0A0N5BEU8_STREA